MGFDSDVLHALVRELTGKEHISDLTRRQAHFVIEHLMDRLEPPRSVIVHDVGPNRLPRHIPLATRPQRRYIESLTSRLGWEDPKRLQGFLQKYAGTDSIEWLTRDKAASVIEGLKSLVRQETDRRAGNARQTVH